jgi:hypothetical protein
VTVGIFFNSYFEKNTQEENEVLKFYLKLYKIITGLSVGSKDLYFAKSISLAHLDLSCPNLLTANPH